MACMRATMTKASRQTRHATCARTRNSSEMRRKHDRQDCQHTCEWRRRFPTEAACAHTDALLQRIRHMATRDCPMPLRCAISAHTAKAGDGRQPHESVKRGEVHKQRMPYKPFLQRDRELHGRPTVQCRHCAPHHPRKRPQQRARQRRPLQADVRPKRSPPWKRPLMANSGGCKPNRAAQLGVSDTRNNALSRAVARRRRAATRRRRRARDT